MEIFLESLPSKLNYLKVFCNIFLDTCLSCDSLLIMSLTILLWTRNELLLFAFCWGLICCFGDLEKCKFLVIKCFNLQCSLRGGNWKWEIANMTAPRTGRAPGEKMANLSFFISPFQKQKSTASYHRNRSLSVLPMTSPQETMWWTSVCHLPRTASGGANCSAVRTCNPRQPSPLTWVEY